LLYDTHDAYLRRQSPTLPLADLNIRTAPRHASGSAVAETPASRTVVRAIAPITLIMKRLSEKYPAFTFKLANDEVSIGHHDGNYD